MVLNSGGSSQLVDILKIYFTLRFKFMWNGMSPKYLYFFKLSTGDSYEFTGLTKHGKTGRLKIIGIINQVMGKQK